MSGFVGYVGAMTGIVIIEIVWLAIAGFLVATTALPFLVVLGNAWNNPAMIAGGLWFALPDGIWIACIITVIWCAIINVAGMTWYARLQRLFFWPGLVLLSAFMVLLAITPHNVAIGNFDAFMSSVFKMDNADQSILTAASKLGWTTGGSLPWRDDRHDSDIRLLLDISKLGCRTSWRDKESFEFQAAVVSDCRLRDILLRVGWITSLFARLYIRDAASFGTGFSVLREPSTEPRSGAALFWPASINA